MRMNEVLFGHVPSASIVNQPYSNISHWEINVQHFDFASARLTRHSVIHMQKAGILLGLCNNFLIDSGSKDVCGRLPLLLSQSRMTLQELSRPGVSF